MKWHIKESAFFPNLISCFWHTN